MAVNPSEDVTTSPHNQGWATAIAGLREEFRPRAVQLASDVLTAALRAPRHSLPVRAHPPHDRIHISDQVIISGLREAIDTHVLGAATGRVALTVQHDQVLTGVTIELFAQFGSVLIDIADAARSHAHGVLEALLGGPDVHIEIVPMHVHFTDVTRGNPKLEQPGER